MDLAIKKISRSVHPDLKNSKTTIDKLKKISNNIIKDIIEYIHFNNEITGKDIQDTIKDIFPEELARHSISEGGKAVRNANYNDDEKISIAKLQKVSKYTLLPLNYINKEVNKYISKTRKINELLAADIKRGKKLRSYKKKPLSHLLAADIKRGKKLKKVKRSRIKKKRSYCKQPPDYYCNTDTLRWNLVSSKRKFSYGRYRSFKFGSKQNINSTGLIYLAAVVEYILAELLELGGNITINRNANTITPNDIDKAIDNDSELKKLIRY